MSQKRVLIASRLDLTVLSRTHSARIYVHIRIYFDGSDFEPRHLEQKARRRRCENRFQYTSYESCYCFVPMTPFPMPLTTPPDTRIYFVITTDIVGDNGRRIWSIAGTKFEKLRDDVDSPRSGAAMAEWKDARDCPTLLASQPRSRLQDAWLGHCGQSLRLKNLTPDA